MIKKTLVKHSIVRGPVREVTGLIRVIFNNRSEIVQIHNRSTHDEENKEVFFHLITCEIKGSTIDTRESSDENEIMKLVTTFENKLYLEMTRISNEAPNISNRDRLKLMGFNEESR